jgi:hypothetical protein
MAARRVRKTQLYLSGQRLDFVFASNDISIEGHGDEHTGATTSYVKSTLFDPSALLNSALLAEHRRPLSRPAIDSITSAGQARGEAKDIHVWWPKVQMCFLSFVRFVSSYLCCSLLLRTTKSARNSSSFNLVSDHAVSNIKKS